MSNPIPPIDPDASDGSPSSSASGSGWEDVIEAPLRDTGDHTLDQSVLDGDSNHSAGFTLGEDCSINLPEVLGGYRVGRRIGRGGMGEVYQAEHQSMGRTVALKVLPQRWLTRASSVDRFYEEVRAASQLMHPNIVTAFDAGEFEGIHFLAMEYVQGQTLSQVMNAEGPMSIGDATSAIRQTAFALHHAHTAGIVHRDVKPGNLMRSDEGTIKLLDLGLARFSKEWYSKTNASRLLSSGSVAQSAGAEDSDPSVKDGGGEAKPRKRTLLGTLAFISPEQLEDAESADARSDQYSLGATLFYLLIGHPPYQGEMLEQVYGHRHGAIPNLMTLRGDVDLTLANIFKRMMAKDPAERYGSMDEVARAMAPYDNDRSTPAWVLDFAQRKIQLDGSTANESHFQTGSTHRKTLRVMGIELGLTHSATAFMLGDGSIHDGRAAQGDSGPKSLFRMAVASKRASENGELSSIGRNGPGQLQFGEAAYQSRDKYPRSVAHCQLMYVGREDMVRELAGKACPPEIATALCMRRLVGNTLMHQVARPDHMVDLSSEASGHETISEILGPQWQRNDYWPDAVAITVPSCYDQLHRRAIHLSARLAGLPSIRLIDRCLAIAYSAMDPSLATDLEGNQNRGAAVSLDEVEKASNILYVGLTAQALDVAVLGYEERQLSEKSTSGHWHHGVMAWAARLVEIIASRIPDASGHQGAALHRQHGAPTNRKALKRAVRIQIAGEKAMNTLLLLPQTVVEVNVDGQVHRIVLKRSEWLAACEDLIVDVQDAIKLALQRASIGGSDIDRCLVHSPLLRLPVLRERIFAGLEKNAKIEFYDAGDAARGAAACVAAELPGQDRSSSEDLQGSLLPVVTVAGQSIGFVIADSSGKRKILPIIRRGTDLPARTNRQLRGLASDGKMKLALVESSGVQGDSWQTLGRHAIEVDPSETSPSRRLGFEVDINGLMSIHLERPDLERTIELPTLPVSPIDSDSWSQWQSWVETHA